MPDHLHGVLILSARDTAAPRKPLGGIVGAFKTESTNRINRARGTPGGVVWQRDFWDHVVRDEADLIRIRAYIRTHPPHVFDTDRHVFGRLVSRPNTGHRHV